ncbi:MAG: alkaline phosphatase family protein [Saprospiraceae bacterium]|nr:alkaline phosphatase family protein [Saprospiraceae bacterium]
MPQIIIGHTTASSSQIWARTEIEGNWWLVLSQHPFDDIIIDFNNVKVDDYFNSLVPSIVYLESRNFLSSNGLTNTFNISSLENDTNYFYLLVASNEINEIKDIERLTFGKSSQDYFRTMKYDLNTFSFGFYSCNDFEKTGSNRWPFFYKELKSKDAKFVIGGGDQMYADSSGEKYNIWKWLKKFKNHITAQCSDVDGNLIVDMVVDRLVVYYRELYVKYWKDHSLKDVYKQFPQYMIWDDHEIMDGWGSLTVQQRARRLNSLLVNDDLKLNKQLTNCLFIAASKAYYEFQHSHNPKTNINLKQLDTCVWDYNFEYSFTAFYVLDMRGHHDIEAKSGERLLGDQQKLRFENWINKSQVKSKKALFIVSPVPIIHWKDNFANTFDIALGNIPLAKDDFRDEWGHRSNEVERNWLLNLVLNASHERKQKIVFLSGDVHSLSVFKITVENKFKKACVYNITSSGISRKPAPLILQKSICGNKDRIMGFKDGRAIKFAGKTGKNNFTLITSSIHSDEIRIDCEICYYNKLKKQLKSIKIELV